jgi:hypothetical protein
VTDYVPESYQAALEDLSDPLGIDWTEMSVFPAGIRAWAALVLATREKMEAEVQRIRCGGGVDNLRRFNSTLNYIETNLDGFYGLTTVAGRKGLGKTMFALGVGIEAAATQNWQVYYLSAELDQDEIALRFDRYLERWDAAFDCLDYIRIIHVPRGFTPVDYCKIVETELMPDLPILTILDSCNTIADLNQGNYLYWLKEWQLWSMLSRRMSRGAASFLLLSELNKSGRTKGEKLEHWSDVMVTIKGKPEDGHVEMHCDKSRRTKGEGPMGKYVRHIVDSRFYRPEEMQRKLQLVGGSNQSDDDGEVI